VGETILPSVITRMPNCFLLLSWCEGNTKYLLPLLGLWGKYKPSCDFARIWWKP
jgi:hypothetical protein